MDPVTTGILGAIGTGISVIGQFSAASAQKDQAEYQAAVARNNQTIAEQRAQTARQAGQAQATAQGLRERARQGAVRAQLAASGLDVNTGSAEDLREGSAKTGALNQMTAEHNAILDAYGYDSQATGFGAEAGLQDARALNAMTAGLLSAGGTLFSSASKLPIASLLSGDNTSVPANYAWMTSQGGSYTSPTTLGRGGLFY